MSNIDLKAIAKDLAVALGIDLFLKEGVKEWTNKTLDGTHRGDVGRVLEKMVERGFHKKVKILLARLEKANQCEGLPIEDDMARALHAYIPKKDEWREGKHLVLTDWDRLDEAINSFLWLADLPEEEFMAAINAAIHDPFWQWTKLVGNQIGEIAKKFPTAAAVADQKIFGPLNNWLEKQGTVKTAQHGILRIFKKRR